MQEKRKIVPVNGQILVKVVEEKNPSGIITSGSTKQYREADVISSGAWNSIYAGKRVLTKINVGIIIDELLLLSEEDIIAILEENE